MDRALLEQMKAEARGIVVDLFEDDYIDGEKYESALDFAETVIADRLYDIAMDARKTERSKLAERVKAAIDEE